VKLGRLYKVPDWIIAGCTALVADAGNLNLEALSTLGWETAARVAWISREYAMAGLSGHRTAAGIGAIPPAIWRCGNCSATGNFQSGYCFGCRNHTSSISVDMASVVVTTINGAGGVTAVSGGMGNSDDISELVLAAFGDELSQMSE
jgi:hypothetical protein